MVPITLLLPPEILDALAGLPGRAALMRRALMVALVAGVVGKRRGRGGTAQAERLQAFGRRTYQSPLSIHCPY
jgi:hypothetical protein